MTAGSEDDVSRQYRHPYPDPALEAAHPFTPLNFTRYPEADMMKRARALHELLDARRSVRMFSDEDVPLEMIELAIMTASTAPSGAHKQPWRFVATRDEEIKRKIRQAAEEEERINYLDNRMNADWQSALAPLGTDHHKEFLEIAPWIVVLFEERYEVIAGGERRKNYYVKESVGIAAGMFITAIHNMGLATLTHTPTPMGFLRRILGRPENERPFIMFPVGYPLDGTKVPDLTRKPLDEVAVVVDHLPDTDDRDG